MADNVTLNAGTGGDTIAADDVGGAKYQRVKLSLGADGTVADAPVGGGTEAGVLRVTLASDSTGVVSVDDNGGALTVDGTVELGATTLAALETITVVGSAAEDAAASGNPVLVGGRYDSSARTLETGDAGAIALNASGQVLVEIAAGAGSGGTAMADGATFTRNTTSLTPAGAVVESSAPTLTSGDIAGLSQTTGGALRVAVASGGVAGKVDDAAFTAATDEGVLMMGVASADTVDSGDAGAIAMTTARALHVAVQGTVTVGSHAVTNAGTFATQVDGAALTALQLIDNACIADDAAFTPATSGVHVAGFFADEAATDSVDEGDAGAARMTLDRKQIVTPYVHAAAGGASNYTALSTAAVLSAVIKASAGKVFSLEVFNVNAAARYVRLYNQTGAPADTDTANVVWQGIIPGATTGGGFTISWPMGKQFSTGIGIRASTGAAHNDTGALAASELTFNVSYA